jgi:hypothetical protein
MGNLYKALYVEFWKKHGDAQPEAQAFYNEVYMKAVRSATGQRGDVLTALKMDGAEAGKFLRKHLTDYSIAVREHKEELERGHGIAPGAVVKKHYHRRWNGRAAARVAPATFYWAG